MARLLFHTFRLAAMVLLVASIGVVVLWARSYRHSQCIAAFVRPDAPYCVIAGVVQGGVECVVNCEDTITDSTTILDTPLPANQSPIPIPHLKYGFGCGVAADGEFRARMPALVFSLLVLGLSAATGLIASGLQRKMIAASRA